MAKAALCLCLSPAMLRVKLYSFITSSDKGFITYSGHCQMRSGLSSLVPEFAQSGLYAVGVFCGVVCQNLRPCIKNIVIKSEALDKLSRNVKRHYCIKTYLHFFGPV